MQTNFKATLLPFQTKKISEKSSHNGKWQQFKMGEDSLWAWSCCMSESEKGRGCNVKLDDGNKWKLLSFNNS